MESSSPDGSSCLNYDLEQARLEVVEGQDRHEVPIRAQAHRLVRYMVERNAAGGGSPVLCTHEELMHAVWADEPMHTREELAKLVWEIRKKLEPLGAAQLIENVRGLGYRLHTCSSAPEALPQPSRPRRWLLVAVVAVVVLAAVATGAVLATRGDGSNKPASRVDQAKLRTFVDRVENVLQQARAGRREISLALTRGFNCSISPHEAGQRIASVADNRQSILGQLGNFQAPTQRADDSVTYLQQALQQSIEADRHYRDAFFETAQAKAGCPPPKNRDFTLAAQSNARATAAKKHFVSTFNPLAASVHRQTWSAGAF
jgi:DNA-binding winged helix-turn-helix (wHTH) protein